MSYSEARFDFVRNEESVGRFWEIEKEWKVVVDQGGNDAGVHRPQVFNYGYVLRRTWVPLTFGDK